MEYTRVWDFFDKIYCISVEQRNDRRKIARQQFARAGLLERVEFIHVRKHPDNPEQGIYASHLFCMRKGLDAGASTILIFEDDILFADFSATALERCCAALATQPHWNALFLGCMIQGLRKTKVHSLVQIRYQCLTHGYAVKAEFARHLVTIPWQGIPYDGLLKLENRHFFALYPMPAFQSNSPTDNRTVRIDKFRRRLGGLQRLQRFNIFFYRYKTAIITGHIMAAIMLLLALYKNS